MRDQLLLLDGVGNLLLGVLLLAAPVPLSAWLGLDPGGSFFASLFGAVLVGIGIALLVERNRGAGVTSGLGLTGALVINFCFGFALAGWLLFGGLEPTGLGRLVLWSLVVILVGLSGIEMASERTAGKG